MRVLVEKECGDASLLQDADREHAGDAERVVGAGDFQLDDKRLYARELKVSFDDTGSTRAIYPGSNAPQVIK